jgi:Holliday junction resolvasome RuvABC ATP-dependent DNA helicase subunit
LIQAGFLTRTPQGRKANLRDYDHLNLRPKGGVNQQELL